MKKERIVIGNVLMKPVVGEEMDVIVNHSNPEKGKVRKIQQTGKVRKVNPINSSGLWLVVTRNGDTYIVKEM